MSECRDPWPAEELAKVNVLLRLGQRIDPAPGSILQAKRKQGRGKIMILGISHEQEPIDDAFEFHVVLLESDTAPERVGIRGYWTTTMGFYQFLEGRPLYYCEQV